jgi:hypothetical protein
MHAGLPLAPEVGGLILAAGLVVLLVVGYDLYRTYGGE